MAKYLFSFIYLVFLFNFGYAKGSHSPYIDHTDREIKSLSDSEIESLTKGEGMGFALAAELNNYAGPLHVLEPQDKLNLSEQQLTATQSLFNKMREQAKKYGAELIEAERELNRLFADAEITSPTLNAQVQAIAILRAELRATHLQAHIEQNHILSKHQRHLYNKYRGYNNNHPHIH